MGYAVICPNLYYRLGHGTPEDVAAKGRAAGGVPDDQVVADLAAGAAFDLLPISNGKVGIFGTCSGGGMPTWRPAARPSTTPWWTAGAAAW